MTFSLRPLSHAELETVATTGSLPGRMDAVEPGAVPLPFVVARALALANAGFQLPWATTFVIVDEPSGRVVGSCGFKGAPKLGQVEVGYGVAVAARGKGAATAALEQLVQLAFKSGASEVIAEVAPTNHASTHVVQRTGFVQVGSRTDAEREYVIRWAKRHEA